MMNKEVEALKAILRKVEFVDYDDPEEGRVVWCFICGGTPDRGHESSCELGRALHNARK